MRWPALSAALSFAIIALVCASGCGGGGGSSSPPPPPAISVSVSPPTANVPLGGTQQFNAMVSNTSNTGVTWSVNGVTGGNSTVGTISASGLYTAPQNLPSPAAVSIRATSVANGNSSGSATLTVTSDVTVNVVPGSANVELGATLQLNGAAAGSGNPNTAVNWSVNGVAGGNSTVGTVSASGLYTAPQILPAPAGITVTATSQADSAKAASAMLTVTSSFGIAIAGPSSVNTAATAMFNATITPAPMSNPNTNVQWSVNGIPGGDATVGNISAAGLYTAPLVAPQQPTVTVAATALADSSKSASQMVTINSVIGITITPTPALNIALENSQQFTAVVSGTLNQNVVWDVNGIIGGNLIVGTITNPGSGATPATYTAPVNMPGVPVTIRASSQFDPSQTASTSVTFFSNIAVAITPSGATRAVGRIQTLAASVANSMNSNVEWRVNGVLGGDLANGRICVAGFQPCTVVTTPMAAGLVDYEAPANIPAINPVTISASSQADPSKSGSAVVDVVANVSVAVSPATSAVQVNGTRLFSATVTGSANQTVTWSISGAGCSGATCGTITQQGSYNAPAVAPSPNTVTITATSADGMQSGTATVSVVNIFVSSLLPASVTAGAQASFVLRVRGFGFALGSPSADVLVNGSARTTSCQAFASSISSAECTVTLAPADVASAGSLNVEVQNPGAPAQVSNAVQFVIAPDTVNEGVIPLSAGAPAAANQDITVAEPSSAGSGGQQVNVGLMAVAAANGNCNLFGFSISITRPASGTANVEICLFDSTLTGTETYTLSGPGDITVGAPSGSGAVRFTLTLSATTQPGARTLFIKTRNNDKAAASGAIDVR